MVSLENLENLEQLETMSTLNLLFRQWKAKLRSGDIGSFAVVIGLILIWTIFTFLNHRFISPENLSNLALQMAPVGTMALGIVLVLLLGEIDLSAGSVSGLCGAVLAVVHVRYGLHPVLGVLAALCVAALIGGFQGTIIERLGIPSFVVTLSGLIGWQGVQLWTLGKQGTINLSFTGAIAKLSSTFLHPLLGLALAVLFPAVSCWLTLRKRTSRQRRGLPVQTPAAVLGGPVAIGLVMILLTLVLNASQGVPLTLVIFGIIVVVADRVLMQTKVGRHVYATGGNIEAARRAGINVRRIRTYVFVFASMLAAFGGVLAASRLSAVNQSSGGSDTLLNAIAAAVIGGTSLFGGRGRAYSALLGSLVIMSIANGMFLLSLDSNVRFMITGAVLLTSVVVDSFSRRGQTVHR
jgi:D-xylose transport system permease protein